jgi:hypothetical protein
MEPYWWRAVTQTTARLFYFNQAGLCNPLRQMHAQTFAPPLLDNKDQILFFIC